MMRDYLQKIYFLLQGYPDPSYFPNREEAAQYGREALREDYQSENRLFLVWFATVAMLAYIPEDIVQYQFSWIWLGIRVAYLPFVLLIFWLAKLPRLQSTLFPEWEVWPCAVYLSLSMTYFAINSGGLSSFYVGGMYQLLFGIALMPLSLVRFLAVSILCAGSFLVLATIYSTAPAPRGYVFYFEFESFHLFAFMTYAMVTNLRRQKWISKLQMKQNLLRQDETIKQQADDLSKSQVYQSIARMMTMLAHDVRQPFSTLKIGLGMLRSSRDPTAVLAIAQRLGSEVDRGMTSVNGLISDVMEISAPTTALQTEEIDPVKLVGSSLQDVCRIYPKAMIRLSYDFDSRRPLRINVPKATRVFSNIIANAFQAMKYKGEMHIATRDDGDFVEFQICNTGSYIPPEIIGKLFSDFFTVGKHDGTGLGLAIAEKVVTAHGGRIWCESHKGESSTADGPDRSTVDFFFTLPAFGVEQDEKTLLQLALDTEEIIRGLPIMQAAQFSSSGLTTLEAELEDGIIALVKRTREPLRILIVDDEAIYREALLAYLTRSPELATSVQISLADGSDGEGLLAEAVKCDLVVTDIDLGKEVLNGFDLVRSLRSRRTPERPTPFIVIHSNRLVPTDHRDSLHIGADAFLPKPIGRAQLLKLALQVGRRKEN